MRAEASVVIQSAIAGSGRPAQASTCSGPQGAPAAGRARQLKLHALRKVSSIKEVLLIGFYEESVFREFVKSASEQFPNWNIK